jgi:LPS-assembly lipoprotein
MSSPDRRLAPIAAILLTLVGLAGCQVRPLYATGASGAGPQADLPAITVEEPTSRVEQVYRNALLFALRGGGSGASPRYSLTYRMTVREQETLLERGTGTPNVYQLTGSVSFLLKDTTSSDSLFGANVTSTDSYTRSSQSFSNIRAERDAQDRLAKSLAELTEARLAAYFATR